MSTHPTNESLAQECAKLRGALQIATNALDMFRTEASQGDHPAQFYRASGALDVIKEQAGIIPNKAQIPPSKTMLAKDYAGQGMGYA
jgi:hypothetical protein